MTPTPDSDGASARDAARRPTAPAQFPHVVPGIFVAEIPGATRSIEGVPTSIAAFIGWAARGPTTHAARVRSFAEYESCFGGLDRRSLLGYSVRHFFANGGHDALVLRLVSDDAVTASLDIDGRMIATARSPGAWANEYRIEIARLADDPSRFSLSVLRHESGRPPIRVEHFDRLSMHESGERFAPRFVSAESSLITLKSTGGGNDPPADREAAPFAVRGHDGTPLQPGGPAFARKLLPPGEDGGIQLLDRADFVNLVCVPGESAPAVLAALQAHCRSRRRFLIVDGPRSTTVAQMRSASTLDLCGDASSNSALYFPWVLASDPLDDDRARAFPPCGFMAGAIARIDRAHGVWRAPAGSSAPLVDAIGVEIALGDDDIDFLRAQGVNGIRTLPRIGTAAWGVRTLRSGVETNPESGFITVRRLALFIEESLAHGLGWVAFELNGEPLWARIRLEVAAFLDSLFRQGAFAGRSPQECFFVKCGRDTMTENEIAEGVVKTMVGFAPLKPAEFVLIEVRQLASGVPA